MSPSGDPPSPMSREKELETILQEMLESGDDLGHFDSQLPSSAALILEYDYPFDFFDLERKKIANGLNLDHDVPPINAIKSYILDLYTKEKLKLKQELATTPNRISLTVDLWESCTDDTYICLTAHFVDANWKLVSKILTFCTVDPSGDEMYERMLKFLSDWGIEKKIFSLTLDDSSENDILQERLKTQLGLQNGLLCDGEFFHVHCFARVLKLIVKEGLELVSDALRKIRQSILFVRDSESRKEKFKECAEKVGGVDSSVRLHLDTSMSVKSTYSMLKSALTYKHVFESLHMYVGDYELCPSVEEWKRVEKIYAFLLPFWETAKMINGTAHPTSNLYFLQVWKVQCVLVDSSRDEDELIKGMAERMISKFEKYWDEYSVVLAMGAVFDPRMKFSTLAYCYSKLDASTCERKLEQVKEKLFMLFDKYSDKSTSTGVQRTILDQSSSMPLQKKLKSLPLGIFDELKMHHQQLVTDTGKSQLDIYLDESNLDFSCYEDMDVLQWWKSNNNRFPELSILACDLLSVPITTLASDLDFCTGLHVFNRYKDRKLPMNMDVRFCTRSWLYNFGCDDDEIDDDEIEEILNEIDYDDDGDDD